MNNNNMVLNKKSNNTQSNINDIIKVIDIERNNRRNYSWNKLNKTDKNKIMNNFIVRETELNNLDECEQNKLKIVLNKFLESNKYDSDIIYDINTNTILKIKNLEFNIKQRSYICNNKVIINKKNSKSKSNIERLCKKNIKNYHLN